MEKRRGSDGGRVGLDGRRVATAPWSGLGCGGLLELTRWPTPGRVSSVHYRVEGHAAEGSRRLPVGGTCVLRGERDPRREGRCHAIDLRAVLSSADEPFGCRVVLQRDARGRLAVHSLQPRCSRAMYPRSYTCTPPFPVASDSGGLAPELDAFRSVLLGASGDPPICCLDWRQLERSVRVASLAGRVTAHEYSFLSSQAVGGEVLFQVQGAVWVHSGCGVLRIEAEATFGGDCCPRSWHGVVEAVREHTPRPTSGLSRARSSVDSGPALQGQPRAP